MNRPAAVDPTPRLVCGYAPSDELTADPASACWQAIEPVTLRENVSGETPKQATRVRTAWDNTGWRILFEMGDANPWATLTERDGPLWTEEVVEVFIDPVGDLLSYFEVEINPLGTVVDLVLRRTLSGWRKDFAWRIEHLGSAARRTAGGWAAELVVPFESIAVPRPQPGTIWRVNFLRIDRPKGLGTDAELSAWSPTGVRNFHRSEFFGSVEFSGEGRSQESSHL